jgi:hypothetical protein
VAIHDAYPVVPLHALVLPRRHADTWFDRFEPERRAIGLVLDRVRAIVMEKDATVTGFNIDMTPPSGGDTSPCRRRGGTGNLSSISETSTRAPATYAGGRHAGPMAPISAKPTVRWISLGGPDEISNLVLICPNHHRAVHRCDAPFDFGQAGFVFADVVERLSLHRHKLEA